MTGYVINFKENKKTSGFTGKFKEYTTMSLKVNDEQFLKNYNKIWKKIEKRMSIDFENKPVYGEDDKFIKTKMEIYADDIIRKFRNQKSSQVKNTIQMFINNNAGFSY